MELDLKNNKIEVNNNIDVSPVKLEAKLNVNASITESANMITKDFIDSKNKLTRNVGEKIGFCWNFLTAKIRPIMHETIKESEYKIKEIDTKLEKKYNNIPDENKTEPRLSIVGSAIDVLKYNLDEEHIKEMFVNILTSEMDNRKQNKVIPAYIEIIKQLSKEDAILLSNYIKIKNNINELYLLKIKSTNNYYIVYNENNNINYFQVQRISLDNLCRIRIITELDLFSFDLNEEFEQYYDILNSLSNNNLNDCVLTSISFTNFGNQFIDICCS